MPEHHVGTKNPTSTPLFAISHLPLGDIPVNSGTPLHANTSVNTFTQQIGVSVVPRVLLNHVD